MASLFCCDFFCVDTIFHKRIFVFFIMQTRMIVHFGITAHPSMAFIRNQLSAFMFDRIDTQVLLSHDNSGELAWFDYRSLSITQVKLPPYSPNLNAFAQRFVRSAESECFNFFIPFSLRHIRSIMKAYVSYYNHRRPHQGISNAFPCGAPPTPGPVRKKPVLFGLYTDFFTAAA
ncbi:integrase core domain-containing protein [Sediminispirochaeta bajacaliforniensis]|uniref:integrase core domain-containing protein n=1 Tax=Sediminispirochaeta bajacaliforniensis TaxID=148 RepID=UPI00146ACB14|nr:integrase core domain-containing protein [Sediminispirochaeta bajacaliforniensis]